MPRTLNYVPEVSGVAMIALEDIPDDVKEEVEEAYSTIRENGGRIRATFTGDTAKEEADLFYKQAVSYCDQRPAGPLYFRRSPTRGLPENVFDFKVTHNPEKSGKRRSKRGE